MKQKLTVLFDKLKAPDECCSNSSCDNPCCGCELYEKEDLCTAMNDCEGSIYQILFTKVEDED